MNKFLLPLLALGGIFAASSMAKAKEGDDEPLPPDVLPEAPGKYEYEVRLAQGFNTAGECKVMLQARFEDVRGPWPSKKGGFLLFRFVSGEKIDGKSFLLRMTEDANGSSSKVVDVLRRTAL